MNDCEHGHIRVQRHPFGRFCCDCGAEVFDLTPGYWPGEQIGETTVFRPDELRPVVRSDEQRQRDGWLPGWGTTADMLAESEAGG